MNVMDEKGMVDAARKEGLEEGIEQGIEQGLEKGREQGLEKGREEAKISIAINLKKAGIATDIIAQNTGLSKAKIDKL